MNPMTANGFDHEQRHITRCGDVEAAFRRQLTVPDRGYRHSRLIEDPFLAANQAVAG